MSTTEGGLRVPGATLHYRVSGSGPMLLLLQGAGGNAEAMDEVVEHLVDRYTVVSYDRRGMSRSPLDGPSDAPQALEIHAEDAHLLVDALGGDPVLVFGGSLGGLIGLDLVARHPEQVRTLVVHEPPATELLPEQERGEADRSRSETIERFRHARLPALRGLAAAISLDDHEPDAKFPESSPERAANLAFFFTHDAPAALRYRVDLDALRAASTKIVVGAGSASPDSFPHHCAQALADRLEIDCEQFPGAHNGFITHPRGFAAKLADVLTSASSDPTNTHPVSE